MARRKWDNSIERSKLGESIYKNKRYDNGESGQADLAFAIPLFIGNVFQQIYNVADTMIAGYNLGDQAIAAIGATSCHFFLLMNLPPD